MSIRVGVLGPGGVGGLLAGRLGAVGHQVTVLTPRPAPITVEGLTVVGPGSERIATAPAAQSWLAEPVEVLFVTVKATQLLDALTRVPAAMVHGAAIVPLLNGIDHMPLLRAIYPESHVVASTIVVEATKRPDGTIEQVSEYAKVTVATVGKDASAAISLAQLLRGAEIDVTTSDDEKLVLWSKLAMLAPYALLTTGTGQPLGSAREQRPEWIAPLVAEAAAAALDDGVQLDASAIESTLRSMPAPGRSSMLKDRLAGRELELDAIAGPILRALGPAAAPATVAAVRAILESHEAD
jgi:2-dehydropantoate 2-reductase